RESKRSGARCEAFNGGGGRMDTRTRGANRRRIAVQGLLRGECLMPAKCSPALVGAVLVLALSLLPVAARAADDVHFILDWIPTGEHAAYYAGKARGLFEKEGINVRISRGYGSGDTVTKIAGGAGDFGIADISAVMTARQRTGTPVKTIATVYTHSP